MKILSLFLALIISTNLTAKTVVLTDIDDTIKVAHVHSTWGKLIRALKTDLVFQGMPELFSALKTSGKVDSFFYLSNAPLKLMNRSHNKFVTSNKFPAGTVWLRDGMSDQEHKLYHLRKLAREERPSTIILFGDNGEWDSDFYDTFAREFPGIRMITFIRYLYAEGPLASGQFSFVSSLDPYLELQSRGFIRSNLKQGEIIARQIVRAERDGSHDPVVFPGFLDCPGHTVSDPTNSQSDLILAAINKVEEICSGSPFYLDETEF